jgi:ABC-type ATPase involved in cell division
MNGFYSTGAGKTTISRLFFRFYDVLGGAVKVNGKDVRMVTQKSLRGSIGVVPQAASMFNDTIRENIRYGRRNASQEDLDQAARDAQLLGFIESMDEGWDTVVGDRGLKLSGGEKQRAAIARCLLKDPPLVLLDEATSALGELLIKEYPRVWNRYRFFGSVYFEVSLSSSFMFACFRYNYRGQCARGPGSLGITSHRFGDCPPIGYHPQCRQYYCIERWHRCRRGDTRFSIGEWRIIRRNVEQATAFRQQLWKPSGFIGRYRCRKLVYYYK